MAELQHTAETETLAGPIPAPADDLGVQATVPAPFPRLPETPVKTPVKATPATATPPPAQRQTAMERARAGAAAGTAKAQLALAGAREQASRVAAHPVAIRANKLAANQVQAFRDLLGRSHAVLRLEQLTGVDRVLLVTSLSATFVLLVPMDVLGLAGAVTMALCFIRPSYHALCALEGGQEDYKYLLAYFVLLAFIQTLESCVLGLLTKTIPHYFLFKLLIMSYLGHPRLKGSTKVYELVLKGLVADKPQSPPKSDEGYNVTPPKTGSSDGFEDVFGAVAPIHNGNGKQ